jgi:hypothetical protein
MTALESSKQWNPTIVRMSLIVCFSRARARAMTILSKGRGWNLPKMSKNKKF